AGQLAIDPKNPDEVPGDAGAQTRLILRNIGAILEEAGSSLDRLLQVTVYVSDIAAWEAVNAAFAEVLGAHRPARAIVPVGPLPRGREVESVATAAVGCAAARAPRPPVRGRARLSRKRRSRGDRTSIPSVSTSSRRRSTSSPFSGCSCSTAIRPQRSRSSWFRTPGAE